MQPLLNSNNATDIATTPNGAYFRNRLPTVSEIKNPASLEPKQFGPDGDGQLF